MCADSTRMLRGTCFGAVTVPVHPPLGRRCGRSNLHRSANRQVLTLTVDPAGAVYVGGSFDQVGGQRRRYLAKLPSTGSGAADSDWDPSPNSTVEDLLIGSDGSIYASGWFTSIGGEPRGSLALPSTTGTGSVDPDWQP